MLGMRSRRGSDTSMDRMSASSLVSCIADCTKIVLFSGSMPAAR
jgi:hypothetical protein